MRDHILIQIFVSLLIYSCNNTNSINSSFNEKVTLSVDSIIVIKDVYFKTPRIFNYTDSTLIIASPAVGYASKEYLIYVVSKKNGKVLKCLGREGRGPDELLAINNISIHNNELLFFDAVSRKILHYNGLKDSIYFQSIESQKQSIFLRNLYLLEDNKIMSAGVFGNHMYCYGDLYKEEWAYFLEYPFIENFPKEKQQDLSLARSYAYSGVLLKHPDLPKFAFYSILAEYIQIVGINHDSIKEIKQLCFATPQGQVVFKKDASVWGTEKDAKTYFVGGTTSSSFIYLLYSGKSINQNESFRGNNILVFDWNGNMVKCLQLDRQVYAITVDKNDKELFAFSNNNKTLNNEIVHYTL